MALNPSIAFTGRITAPSANWPYGSSKNETAVDANDGTPYNKERANDLFGFFQALLTEAAIIPSGNPDTVLASDYMDSLVTLFLHKKIRSESSSGAILVTDATFFVDATGGDITFTTPLAADMIINGRAVEILVKRIDTSSNKATIQDIEGQPWDLTGTGRPFIRFTSDGTTKYLVG